MEALADPPDIDESELANLARALAEQSTLIIGLERRISALERIIVRVFADTKLDH